MSYFKDYYQRVINRKTKGFKLVLGGTGLGKTSAIVDVIEQHPQDDKRKFIYIANRIQLLNELKQQIENREGLKNVYVHQKSNHEIVSNIKLEKLFTDEIIGKYHSYLKNRGFSQFKISDIKRSYGFVLENKRFMKGSYTEQAVRNHTRIVTRFFQEIISEAYRKSKDADINQYNNLSQNDYHYLINLPEIKQLFPYIEYKNNPEKKILLVTIQKAFYGIFDGTRTIDLANFDNEHGKNNGDQIIFLDEFDFLENDLISLICQDLDVPNPFRFVEDFYNAMARNKLPFPEYPVYDKIRERITGIIGTIKRLNETFNIPFPQINHFICRDENKKLKGNSIFQTSYSVVETPIYLDDTKREGSFNLSIEKTSLSAFILLDHVNLATAQIIGLFKDLEFQYPNIYKEMIRHCFETSDIFKETLRKIKQHPFRKQLAASNYDKLHYNGFGLYEIQDLRQETDSDEVAFKYYALHTSPETLLLHLTKHNFVFGLSATAEIPRLIKNFDLRWLKGQLKSTYFELTKEDIIDIQNANNEKQQGRQNQIHFVLARDLSPDNPQQKRYIDFIYAIAHKHPTDDFGEEIFGSDEGNWRKRRVNLFFSTLFEMIAIPPQRLECDTHLLFYSSYRQIEYIFKKEQINEEGLYKITKPNINDNELFDYYEIIFQQIPFLVVFYNAAKAKEIAYQEQAKETFYGLFWRKKPVILITTYPSAGNGVNLQYYATEEGYKTRNEYDKHDFTHIHLLDSPYFYFSPINHEEQTEQDKNATIKNNIYYLAKLFNSKKIGQGKFHEYLRNIRQSGQFNTDYLKTEDGLLNQLSVFIQAIGRIERIWTKMDDQTIHLSRDVYNVFETFCTHPDYQELKERVKNYFSNNLNQLFEQIIEHHKKTCGEIENIKQINVGMIDQKCRMAIQKFLRKIDLLHEGKQIKRVRNDWNELRYLALKHDFQSPLLRGNDCIFDTPYFHYGKLCINERNEIIPYDQWNQKYSIWNLDFVYHAIRHNDTIRNHFEKRGYELGFNNHGTFFTPYFYQAILSGAIGEEAIKAIFEKEKISLDDYEISDELFELADTKVRGKPWYIDCKNYSERTLQNFSLQENDPLWHPKLNETYFKEHALKKFFKIQQYHHTERKECKLIYVNFAGTQDRIKRYLDENFNDTGFDFVNARIIIVQGVIERIPGKQNYNRYCQHFESFITHLRSNL